MLSDRFKTSVMQQWGINPQQRRAADPAAYQPPPMVMPPFQAPDMSYLSNVMGGGLPMNAGLRFNPTQPGQGMPALGSAPIASGSGKGFK